MNPNNDFMIETQLITREITDENVINAFKKTDRAFFVNSEDPNVIYGDFPVSIGSNQTISQPYIVALMLQLCCLTPIAKVLEIGTGSGYQTALLSQLTEKVYSVERIYSLYTLAQSNLSKLPKKINHNNIYLRNGNGFNGWVENSPYDAIILSACPNTIPDALIQQLKNGGILVGPEGSIMQYLLTIKKQNNSYIKKIITAVRFVPMINDDNVI